MPPREPCDHGRYEQHGAEPPVGLVLGPGQEFLCLGGRTLTPPEALRTLLPAFAEFEESMRRVQAVFATEATTIARLLAQDPKVLDTLDPEGDTP